MGFEAKVIAHSVSETDKEIITYQLKYPRFIHAEFMTHRMLSRNASSSRAIPISKVIEQVRMEPAMPTHWGKNQPGMQAKEEMGGVQLEISKGHWITAAHTAAYCAEMMMNLGIHKQVANRILEPFQWISVVCTATEWDNFHALRSHPDAQPEIQLLSNMMLEARAKSTPCLMKQEEWHLPYIYEQDWGNAYAFLRTGGIAQDEPKRQKVIDVLKQVSAARCARVSYLTHDGKETTIKADLELCNRLAGAQPFHASPFEHQATPDIKWRNYWSQSELHGNLVGWCQYRKYMLGECIEKYPM